MEKGINMGRTKKIYRGVETYLNKDGTTTIRVRHQIPQKHTVASFKVSSPTANDYKIAEQIFDDHVSKCMGKQYQTTNNKTTVAQLCTKYMDNKFFNESTTTKADVDRKFRLYIIPKLGNIKISDLQREHQNQLWDYVKTHKYDSKKQKVVKLENHSDSPEKLETSYLVKIVRELNNALNYGVKNKWITKNPIKGFSDHINDEAKLSDKKSRKIKFFLQPEQVKAISDKLKNGPFEYAVILMALTGMRRNEVLGLKWKDFKKDTIRGNEMYFLDIFRQVYRCKYRKTLTTQELDGSDHFVKQLSTRTIAIHPEDLTVKILKKIKGNQHDYRIAKGIFSEPDQEDLVFLNFKTMKPYSPNSLYHDFKDAVVAASEDFKKGLEGSVAIPQAAHKGGVHNLRHYHASQLLRKGVDFKSIQKRLGHSTLAITMDLYADHDIGHDIEGARKTASDFADYALD